jgi:hypothetical protein
LDYHLLHLLHVELHLKVLLLLFLKQMLLHRHLLYFQKERVLLLAFHQDFLVVD